MIITTMARSKLDLALGYTTGQVYGENPRSACHSWVLVKINQRSGTLPTPQPRLRYNSCTTRRDKGRIFSSRLQQDMNLLKLLDLLSNYRVSPIFIHIKYSSLIQN